MTMIFLKTTYIFQENALANIHKRNIAGDLVASKDVLAKLAGKNKSTGREKRKGWTGMIKKIKEFFRSVKNKKLNIGRNQGAAWAVAYIAKYENISLAERMAREWGFRTMADLKNIDAYDLESIIPLLGK